MYRRYCYYHRHRMHRRHPHRTENYLLDTRIYFTIYRRYYRFLFNLALWVGVLRLVSGLILF